MSDKLVTVPVEKLEAEMWRVFEYGQKGYRGCVRETLREIIAAAPASPAQAPAQISDLESLVKSIRLRQIDDADAISQIRKLFAEAPAQQVSMKLHGYLDRFNQFYPAPVAGLEMVAVYVAEAAQAPGKQEYYKYCAASTRLCSCLKARLDPAGCEHAAPQPSHRQDQATGDGMEGA